MRCKWIPSSWQPSSDVLRFREFTEEGLPLVSVGFSVGTLAFGAWALIGMGSHVETARVVLGVVSLLIGAGFAWFAVHRYFVEPDGYLEIDLVGRRVLVVSPRGIEGMPRPRTQAYPPTDVVMSFDEITQLVAAKVWVSRSVRYRSGVDVETRAFQQLTAYPAGVVVLRRPIGSAFERAAQAIGRATGKVVYRQHLHG